MENTAIILQARISSTRLPGKLLLPLRGLSIFEHILMRLKCAKIPKRIIVATTASTISLIEEIVEKYKATPFIGSEEDVLSRFADATRTFGVGTVVRATADNPLVAIDYIDKALVLHKKNNADLTTYPRLPYGTGIEIVGGKLLEEIQHLTEDPYEREHVTQYIYRHESEFTIIRGIPEKKFRRPEIRLTVDTLEDYKNMCAIYDALYRGRPIRLRHVIDYLNSR